MRRDLFPSRNPVLLAGILSAAFLVTLPGRLTAVPVVAPTLTITAPADGATVPYRVQIESTANDPDGTISHYEYAVDPPAAFSEGEILDPEGSGLTVESVPGIGGPDTTRVTKLVGEDPVSFDYIATPDSVQLIAFGTPVPDSVIAGGQKFPATTFHGEHRFYKRAIDADGEISVADGVAFTATTLVPVSEILRPLLLVELMETGPEVRVVYDGQDPDGGEEAKPVGYLWALLRLDTLEPPIPITSAGNPRILFDKGAVWTYQDSSDQQLDLVLEVPGSYVFGVRGVDEAGAEEPYLEYGRNAFRFLALPGGGLPVLTLDESTLGNYVFPPGTTQDAGDIPVAVPFEIQVGCSAEKYGGICTDYRWVLDPVDPMNPNWGSWESLGGMAIPLILDDPGTHSLMVQLRDDVDSTTTGTLTLNGVEFLPERDVLLIDDSFDDTYPRDSDRDAFWQTLSDAYGLTAENSARWHVFGTDDRQTLNPQPIPLAEMGKYRLLVWDNRGSGFDGLTSLIRSTAVQNRLGRYLRAQGMVWLSGTLTVGALTLDPSGNRADLVYPKQNLGPGHFAYDFLKLHSSRIMNDKGTSTDGRHNLVEAQPFPGRPEIYPLLHEDQPKQNPIARGRGIPFADAVFDPILAHSEPGFRGVLDSLYVYGATANLLLGLSSVYDQKVCGLRWHDPDPDPDQGRTQWFGFPMYFMKNPQAQETFNRSLDWFLNPGTVPVALTVFEASRTPEGATLHWEVGESSDHAGFRVYRQVPERGRVAAGPDLLSGSRSYTFLDTDAPEVSFDYWLAEIARDGRVSWHGPRSVPGQAITRRLALAPNRPNPFRSSTRIDFELPERGAVRVEIFDVSGRRVAGLLDEEQGPGPHTLEWNGTGDDGRPAAAGIYLIRLIAGRDARIQKAILTR